MSKAMACTWTKLSEARRLFYDSLRKSSFHIASGGVSKSTSTKSNNHYCVDLVRKCDRENYLATLLIPKDVQRAVFALRAFNVELAQVQDNVSEKQIGLMRMQFWRDTINSIFTKTGPLPQTPVVKELTGVSRYYNLSQTLMQRMVDARASELERNRFATVESIEERAESINSSLYYLMLECLGIQDGQAERVASHLGKAQGLVTILRAVPFHASRRSVYLPMDKLAQHKVSQEDIIRGKSSQGLKDVISDIANGAHEHLEKARSLRATTPATSKSKAIFLNAIICDSFLKTLEKQDFDIFSGSLQHKDHLLAWRMYFNKLRGKF